MDVLSNGKRIVHCDEMIIRALSWVVYQCSIFISIFSKQQMHNSGWHPQSIQCENASGQAPSNFALNNWGTSWVVGHQPPLWLRRSLWITNGTPLYRALRGDVIEMHGNHSINAHNSASRSTFTAILTSYVYPYNASSRSHYWRSFSVERNHHKNHITRY